MDRSEISRTILVVDDSLVSRLILQKAFLQLGINDQDLVMLESGESAVREVC